MEKYSPDKKQLVMTRDEVRSFDSWAINKLGISGAVLMENAGRSCAELIKEKLKNHKTPKVCIFCGKGNNGGDGYVIARHLVNSSFKVKVIIIGEQNQIKGDAKINLDILTGLNQPIEELDIESENISDKIKTLTQKSDMLIDCIFGTGLKGNLSNEYKNLIEAINAQNIPILAVDIPSGLDCNSGKPLTTAIKAKYTVTFVAVKKGFANSEIAAKYTGEVFVASIGIEPNIK